MLTLVIRVTVARTFALAAQQQLFFDFTAKAAAGLFFGVDGNRGRGRFNGQHRWGRIHVQVFLRRINVQCKPIGIH